MNSPLVFTDPSGFSPFWKKKWFKTAAAIGIGMWTGVWIGDGLIALAAGSAEGSFAGMFVTFAEGGVGSLSAAGAAASGAAGGFAAGLVSTGGDVKASLQQGLIGGLSGGLYSLAGGVGASFGTGGAEHYAAHAGAGCLVAVAQGGKCGQGAASALVAKFASLNSNFGKIGNGIATVIAGGTTSVIGGGKFANGATSALYGYLYNEVMSQKNGSRMHSEEFEALKDRSFFRGYHRYDNWTPCEGSCDKESVLFQLNEQPAPGIRIGNQTSIRGLGIVTHDSDSQGTLNTTSDGKHALAPGLVARVLEGRDGVLGIRSIGIGWGIFPSINESSAPSLWRAQDKAIFERANRCGTAKCQ